MKLAVLGLGFMGSTHVKAIQSLEGAELGAVVSNDERTRNGDFRHIQGNLGGPGQQFDFARVRKYTAIEDLLSDPDVDAVDLCLPTDMHAAVAIEALRAGKHVLVEKPIALDGAAADRMIEEAGRAGRILMAAQVLRFMPPYMALREALSDGQLGPVRSAMFRRRCAAPAWGRWLKSPEKSGGGVFDLLIHDVDMMLHLLGPPGKVSATGHEDSARGIDIINAQFYYPHGGVVLVTGGWHHPKAYPFSMEYTVTADAGTVEYSSAGRDPALYRDDGTEEKLRLVEQDGYAAEIAYFVECCRAGAQPSLCPAAESASAVKLTRLMLEARNRNGEWIECRI